MECGITEKVIVPEIDCKGQVVGSDSANLDCKGQLVGSDSANLDCQMQAIGV